MLEDIESHLATFGIFSPGTMSPDQLLDEFIARQRQLDIALEIVRDNKVGQPQQHLVVIGPRGMGKTMLLLALAYKVERDPELGKGWLAVVFPEEGYGIGDLADFWLAAAGHLLAALDEEGRTDEVEELREADPEDIEEQAQELFLRFLGESGKRALIVLENLDDFFEAVTDEVEQHRLRAFLMEDDRVMVAASSPSYFEEAGKMDQPFYEFFRIIRLERFDRKEMTGMLNRLADVREGGEAVKKVIHDDPGRIESLRILTGGNPRLVKMVYRLLAEGGGGSARRDLERLIEDCTPYFKHRIEEIGSNEERRAFDHVAKHWDPVAVGDIQRALRRPSNKVSIYLRRLVDQGFLEEAPGSTPKEKSYQVAERFYNIYYLMRFSRSAKRRLEWLVQAMQVFYSADDFQSRVARALEDWRGSDDPRHHEDREAFLYSLTKASASAGVQHELISKSITAAWDHDQLACLDHLLDRELGKLVPGDEYDLLEFFSKLPEEERTKIGYQPEDASWWFVFGYSLHVHHEKFQLAEFAYRRAGRLDPEYARPWNGLGNSLRDRLDRPAEAEEAYRKAIAIEREFPWAYAGLADLLAKAGRDGEAVEAATQAALLDSKIPWVRDCFVRVCAEESASWIKVLPTLLEQVESDAAIHEMAIRGLEFTVGSAAIEPATAIEMIQSAGAEEPLADIVLALRAMDDRSLLTKASPERRAFAEDFLQRLEQGGAQPSSGE